MTADIDRDALRADVALGRELTGSTYADEDPDYYPAMRHIFDAVPALLDALDQADSRIARLTAQTETRRRAVTIYQQRARDAEARIAAVQDVFTQAHKRHEDADYSDILHALNPPCSRGICALGDGHDGPCRC